MVSGRLWNQKCGLWRDSLLCKVTGWLCQAHMRSFRFASIQDLVRNRLHNRCNVHVCLLKTCLNPLFKETLGEIMIGFLISEILHYMELEQWTSQPQYNITCVKPFVWSHFCFKCFLSRFQQFTWTLPVHNFDVFCDVVPTFCDSQDEVRNNTRQKQSLDWAKAASVIGFTEYMPCVGKYQIPELKYKYKKLVHQLDFNSGSF